jgi:CRP-like cAMP-binding protein
LFEKLFELRGKYSMDYVSQSEIRNHFLARLPEDEYKQLLPDLEQVKMEIGDPIQEPYEPIEYVYFPINCVISQVTALDDGFSVEAGVIGREGCSGIELTLLNKTSPRSTHIQLPGHSLRIKSDKFIAALEQSTALDRLMRRLTFAYLTQVAQVVACNSHHNIETRLARWLLMCHDRTDGNELRITQDFISQMLGVHRPGVSIGIIALKNAGLVNNQRGVIIIENRAGLEEIVCECYDAINREYNKYLDSHNR